MSNVLENYTTQELEAILNKHESHKEKRVERLMYNRYNQRKKAFLLKACLRLLKDNGIDVPEYPKKPEDFREEAEQADARN